MSLIQSKPNILYISTDGVMEPLGQSQVLSYIKALSASFSFTLISAEKQSDLLDAKKFHLAKKGIASKSISWHPLQFQNASKMMRKITHFLHFSWFIFIIAFKNKHSLIHLRSLISGLLALPTLLLLRKKFIFDMRGFWADERVDRSKLKRSSVTYRFLKKVEKTLLKRSEAIVCLTNESKALLLADGYAENKIFVIRTCADEKIFYPNQKLTTDKYINFVHLGSTHTAYDLMPVLNFFHHFSSKNFKLHVVTRDFVLEELRDTIKKNDLIIPNLEVLSLDYAEVASFLRKMDVGIFFAKENYAIKASFPTKIAEFLATGIPVICNYFNKDISVIEENELGILSDFSTLSFETQIFENFFSELGRVEISKNCIAHFQKEFTSSYGISLYQKIYEQFI